MDFISFVKPNIFSKTCMGIRLQWEDNQAGKNTVTALSNRRPPRELSDDISIKIGSCPRLRIKTR